MGIIKNCLECGKEFETVNNRQKYCCEICRRKHGKIYDPLGERIFKCQYCGKEFTSNQRKKYCCAEHGIKANNKKRYKKKMHQSTSLSEVARLAREQGLTYGQYMQREYVKKASECR